MCCYCTDVAEWVLNKCALSGVSTRKVPNNTVNPVSIEVDGTDPGDDQNENNTGKCYPNGGCMANWEPKKLIIH